jgi:hypothetical protein
MSGTADTTRFVQQMRQMSAGDLSMLEALIGADGNERRLTTTLGSSNFRLWSDMAELGWLVECPDMPPLQGAEDVVVKCFALARDGRGQIANLLSEFARDSEVSNRMAAFHNGPCMNFASDMLHKVKEGGGGHRDVIFLTAMTAARIMKTAFRKEDIAAATDQLCNAIKQVVAR